MKPIQFYFREEEILRLICKIRVKLAKNRSKKHLIHLLTSNPKFNYHEKEKITPRNEFEVYQKTITEQLNEVLPSRKNWVKLGESSRQKPNNSKEFLTSNDKNFYSLLKTIKKHKKKNSKEIWFINLNKLIAEIQDSIVNNSHKLSTPIIVPKLKEKLSKTNKNECRPICMFNLKDRIILSLTNKFLTQLFDDKFQDSSYAFRAKKNQQNQILSHHDCIKDILDYRLRNIDKKLFVAECDMKKFYDTVNHKIVKMKFDELIKISQNQYPLLDLTFVKNTFYSYLDCFCFNKDIPKENNYQYWNSYGITNGFFGWIDNDINIHYSDISDQRIGVPQGGALSGLIANIYLNEADIQIQNFNVFYSRFCDDMIIISTSLRECIEAKEKYVETLNALKLFPHPFKEDIKLIDFDDNNEIFYKPFWSGKSKGPYQWGKIEEINFPWIGFVGYEINNDGEIRIRKKSFEKEIKKQKITINEIKKAIKIGRRKPKGTATESAINRLIGMSVGRIGIENFDEVSTDLCWKNGFKLLTINKHSLKQIKQLDRNRNKYYYKLLKDVKLQEDIEFPIDIEKREIIKYNKPFSYFYQILERQMKDDG